MGMTMWKTNENLELPKEFENFQPHLGRKFKTVVDPGWGIAVDKVGILVGCSADHLAVEFKNEDVRDEDRPWWFNPELIRPCRTDHVIIPCYPREIELVQDQDPPITGAEAILLAEAAADRQEREFLDHAWVAIREAATRGHRQLAAALPDLEVAADQVELALRDAGFQTERMGAGLMMVKW